MPSALHEALVDLIRRRPEFAAELLTLVSDVELPEFDHARTECGDFPDINPTEYRADGVVVLATGTTPVLGVVIEAQLRPDKDKSWSWPVYLTTLRSRLRCPTALLVLCLNKSTAAWCREPIEVAPGFVLVPMVLGPDEVPIVTDQHTASTNPEMATLSAIAHRRHPDREAILANLVESMVDVQNGKMYIDLVLAALPETARHYLEGLMTTAKYEYKSDFAKGYFRQGEARGEAKSLLKLLRARGIDVADTTETRILECTDLDQLDTWFDRALVASTLDDLGIEQP
ncbi:hypothetical protein [Nocardia sp. NPDC052566]|uniref:hypothetical protein n=1 Tax=Nocardia sp. NPDC052566 TaxID=3364330 RepID=UPI0037C6CA8D